MWMPFCAIRATRGELHCLAEGAGCGCGQCGYGKKPLEPAASDGAQEHAAPQETERVSLPEFLAEIQAQGPRLSAGARGLCIFALLTDGTSMLPMRRAELLRALVNLVENAARYTPPGAGR